MCLVQNMYTVLRIKTLHLRHIIAAGEIMSLRIFVVSNLFLKYHYVLQIHVICCSLISSNQDPHRHGTQTDSEGVRK